MASAKGARAGDGAPKPSDYHKDCACVPYTHATCDAIVEDTAASLARLRAVAVATRCPWTPSGCGECPVCIALAALTPEDLGE